VSVNDDVAESDGHAGAAPRATSWSSTAGPPRRCSAATAPAPAAPGHAAATTASWRTRPNLSPPAPSLQGCLPRQCIFTRAKYPSRTSWRTAKTGRPSRENRCSVTSRRSACPAQDRCPAAPSTSSAPHADERASTRHVRICSQGSASHQSLDDHVSRGWLVPMVRGPRLLI
jgi:hypothetical protein